MLEVILKNSARQIPTAGLFDKKLHFSKIMSANCHNGLHFPCGNKGIKSRNKCMTGEKGWGLKLGSELLLNVWIFFFFWF